jgi:hypothetical protein
MSHYIINKHEFKDVVNKIYLEEQKNILNEKWSKLSKGEKIFVLEFLKVIYPDKSKLIQESKWYNTLGDIAGIFDPTGVIDVINGISYWRQDDKLFALLSWISVVPLIGDVIGKPVIGALKLGGDTAKMFKAAALAGDAAKVAETATKSGGAIGKFVSTSPTWGVKLLEILKNAGNKVPILRRMFKLIEEYVSVFVTASKEMKLGAEVTKGIGLAEKETLKNTFRGFRDFGGFKNKYLKYISSKDVSLWKKFTAGAPRIFGGNPATRSLMRRTKWYLGFLDFLGIGDFKTTPDELMIKYPNIEQQVNKYNQTEKAQQTWNQDFGSGGDTQTQQTDGGLNTQDIMGINPLEVFLNPLFK